MNLLPGATNFHAAFLTTFGSLNYPIFCIRYYPLIFFLPSIRGYYMPNAAPNYSLLVYESNTPIYVSDPFPIPLLLSCPLPTTLLWRL